MSGITSDFSRGVLTGFIFLILLLSNAGFVYAAESFNSSLGTIAVSAYFADVTNPAEPINPLILGGDTTTPQNTLIEDSVLQGGVDNSNNTQTNQNQTSQDYTNPNINVPAPTSLVPPGSCTVSTLTPEEAKGIMDLTHEGFNGKTITDGSDLNGGTVRDIGDTSLVGKELGGDKALKVTAPNYATTPDKFAFLNGYSFSGPFGLGFILDDTMRIGRCTNLPQSQCMIDAAGENVRTSGVGFVSDLTNSFSSVGTAVKSVAETSLSQEEYAKLQSNYLGTDTNDFTTGSFGKGAAISSSILTSQYTAKNATTCNNSSCIISTYSAFDKYFNAWMTTDMVVSNIGPMLLQKSGKLLTQAYKSFGGSPLKSKFGLEVPQKIMDKISGYASPMSLFGTARDQRFKAIMQEEGIANALEQPLLIQKALWSSGAKGEINKLTATDSPLWKLSPDKRKKVMEAVNHLTSYARGSAEYLVAEKAVYDAAVAAADSIVDPALRQAAKDAAKIDYGMKTAVNLDDWDEVLALDFEDWAKVNNDLFDFGGYALKKNGPWANDSGFVDISTGQPFNLKYVVQQYGAEGSWAKWANSADAQTFKIADDGVSLQLFKIQPKKIIQDNVALQDLRFHLSKMGASTYSVKLPDGTYLPLNEASINYIEANPLLPGHVSIFEAGYVPAEPLTPLDFANRITHKRVVGRPTTAVRNMDDLRNALIQKDYAPRAYTSLLDKQFAAEGDMITKYYKEPVTGVYKGLVLPVLYWDFKQGFGNYTGNKDYSAFLLPDTWSTLNVTQGVDKIYNDSFIDFYANEGSDQGDMFKRAFNSLPLVWTKLVEIGAETNQFAKDSLSKVSGGFFEGSGSMRDTVGDLAFYSHNENCSGCSGKLNIYNDPTKGQYLVLNGFYAPVTLSGFFLEATTPEEKAKSGSAIISYAHSSDLSGKTGQVAGEKIDLSKARSDGLTCDQKLRKFGLGWAGNKAGGVLAGIENLGYLAGFGPGLMVSLAQQLLVGRELQECVDDVDGYYIHFFAPASKQAASSQSKGAVSNEKISEALGGLTQNLDSFVKEKQSATGTAASSDAAQNKTAAVVNNPLNATGATGNQNSANPIENSMDKLKSQFDEFTSKAKQANILQASVDLMAPLSGKVMGKDIFYFWFKDSMMPAEYRTSGKSVTNDGNMQVIENYNDGTLTINGKVILGEDKADHTRMIAQDNRVPAKIVPVTLNKVSAPMTDKTVFSLNTFGEIKVLDAEVLNCIQKAVFDQTGIEYSGDELTQVFGNLKNISTATYGTVVARNGKILLEGMGPRVQGEDGSSFVINGKWETKLVINSANSANTGKFVGMTFEHGSIVLKPETNELIVWVRQHKDAVLSNKDVKGLNAKLTTVKDPSNECDTPAIDLEAVPFNNDELGAKKVENFNKSMGALGPFTQFTTPTKIYEFYTQRDAITGECKNFFRIRDKATGKILTDQEIIGGITQGADGTLKFTTADGKQHELTFSAENGVPKVSYNGNAPETLISAQGPNGSFWYDPEKGLWYPENGLQIPLNQAFKDNGAWFGTDSKGNVTGTPENKITFNAGTNAGAGFSLPSMPETIGGILIFVSLFLLVSFVLTRNTSVRKRRRV